MGIVNGTTNYILTKMSEEGLIIRKRSRRRRTLATREADPTADVEGYDAGRKDRDHVLLAFNSKVTFKDVYMEGSQRMPSDDIQ